MINGFAAPLGNREQCGEWIMQLPGKLVHTQHMQMRWGDMDALGHMNNTVYFRYLEQARISWFDSLGVNYAAGEGAILGSINCRFRLPAVYPAELAISLHASNARNSSFVLSSAITDRADDRLYATAEATMVWVNLAEGKSRPMPDWLRSLIQS
jgi:acyl-CoA thioester hydrolase